MARKSIPIDHLYVKIVKGDVLCEFLYEDEYCVVFNEPNPEAPIHYVVVPKNLRKTLKTADPEDEKLFGHLLLVAKNLAIEKNLHKSGYHVTYFEDYSPKATSPVSIHIFGRALHHMVWPMGPGSRL